MKIKNLIKQPGFLFRAFFLSTFFLATTAHAQIERLTITWTSMLCLQPCVVGLDREFRKIDGVADVRIDQLGGRADITWRPDVPLTFPPINTAMSMIGLSINQIFARVRGHIIQTGQALYLVSDVDGTHFLLKSPITPSLRNYNEQFNIYAYALDPATQQQLIDAENRRLQVTIDGAIFEPERSPPLVLIISKKTIANAPTPQ